MVYDIQRAQRAVQFLVDSPYTLHHVKKLRTAVLKPRAMPFKGDAECLNELLVVGRQSLQALENLIEVAEFKRDDRNTYQRLYMAAKRQRDRKAITLEEKLLGKSMSLDERTQLLHKQYDLWNAEKAKTLIKYGDCSWQERNDVTRDFWVRKEAELDELLAEVEKQASRVVRRKLVVQVVPRHETVLSTKLRAAMEKTKPVVAKRR